MPGNVTFADRSLTVHGQRFHLTDWGPADAPTVLFLHGVTGHARTWDHEAAALAGRFRLIALAKRGHGVSDPAHADITHFKTLTGTFPTFRAPSQYRHVSHSSVLMTVH